MEKLLDYLEAQKIKHNFDGEVLIIGDQSYELIYPNIDGLLFDDKFRLLAPETVLDNYVFNFGGKYYFIPKDLRDKPELTELKYIGEAQQEVSSSSFLGVRGAYELLNGSQLYKHWVKKAKFLGVKNLGICERNTLAGLLKFQIECKDNDIKPILGATFTIYKADEDYKYDIKCYVKDSVGWDNLLTINKVINVDSNFIEEREFFKCMDGLIIVLDPKSIDFDRIFPYDFTEDYYYQLDTAEFKDTNYETWYLNNLKKFVHSKFKPVSITDAFYLDKEDSYIKAKLNSIGGFHEYLSDNQYFKSKEDYFLELSELFNPDDFNWLSMVFEQAILNEEKIAYKCKFEINTSERHLPKYKMTPEESKNHKSNEDLFWALIQKGLLSRVDNSKFDIYLERIQKEFEVIQKGDVLDYFLMTRDITNWAQNQGIIMGIGRGSAGGSVISYLLGVIHIDPLQFDLLFERFLNEGRIKVSLPDIDCDFPASARDQIKQYMEQRFGETQVCSVGTYTALKLRGAIKDLSRLEPGVEFKDVNIVTSFVGEKDKTITDLFKLASSNKTVKKFIQSYPNIINDLSLILGQPKAKSVHACAMMIFPKEKDMHHWSPMKLQDGMVVSEWEGNELDSAGFLKEDILGILQLDKFTDILRLIKENYNENIDIYKVPLNDSEVYKYFKRGWNGDVFHFGSPGLTGYCQELKPDNIEELIAAISLYRPGAMENNFHNEFVLRKEGKREIEYFTGTEEILDTTYGVFVYQEQIMKLCQVLGGLSLVEADDVRKAMVKKKYEALHQYKDRFIDYYHKNFPVDKEYATNVWVAIDKASTYLFNRSHAAAYTITGYISQWLKVHYPTEYWTIALNYAPEEKVAGYISEINKAGKISIMPPEINISRTITKTDFNTKTVYWALSAVKQVGEKATEQIMIDKDENGEYFSLEEFIDRHSFKGSKVNKRIIENLIFSGAFDNIEGIKASKDRLSLINKFRESKGLKIPPEDILEVNKNKLDLNWWWNLQQKSLSSVAFFDYPILYSNYFDVDRDKYPYFDVVEFYEEYSSKNRLNASIAGFVTYFEVRESSKGNFARITLENNYDFFTVIVWAEQFEHLEEIIMESKDSLMLINGEIFYDNYKKSNVLQTNDETTILTLA